MSFADTSIPSRVDVVAVDDRTHAPLVEHVNRVGVVLFDQDKACAAGASLDCDDENPCTIDSCDKLKGCQHKADTTQKIACYTGFPASKGTGTCIGGYRTCDGDGKQSATCLGEVVPNPKDACGGGDEDCDGITDEDCVPVQKIAAPVAKRDFGIHIDAVGKALLVAAPGQNNGAFKPSDASVYIYERGADGLYKQTDQVFPVGTTKFDLFGVSLAMDETAGVLVVGAPGDREKLERAGAIYVYTRKTAADKFQYLARHEPPTPVAAGQFGIAVEMTTGHVAVGEYAGTHATGIAGQVHVYPLSKGAILGSPTKVIGSNVAKDNFGRFVRMTPGRLRVSGLYGDTGAKPVAAIFVFDLDKAGKWPRVQVLTAPGGGPMGGSLDLDGKRLIAAGGARMYVFEEGQNGRYELRATVGAPSADTSAYFGTYHNGLSGDLLLAGNHFADPDKQGYATGENHLFVRETSGAWAHKAQLIQQPPGKHLGGHQDAIGDALFLSDYGNATGKTAVFIINAKAVCPDGTGCRCDFTDTKLDCTTKKYIPSPCGDGVQHYGEECDDGNNKDRDGCPSTCKLECPYGYTATAIDDGGKQAISCRALGPLWGPRSISPASQLTKNGAIATDKQTGLAWQVAAVADKTHDAAVGYCDGLTEAGFKDWRLPTYHEYASIFDFKTDKFAAPIFPPDGDGGYFWTADEVLGQPTRAYWFKTTVGHAWKRDKTDKSWARCVRTASLLKAPYPRFVLSGAGTVIEDRWTGKHWPATSLFSNAATVTAASTACTNLTHAGQSDWRLPNHAELGTLYTFQSATGLRSPLFGAIHAGLIGAGSDGSCCDIFNYIGDNALGWGAPSTSTAATFTCVRGP